MDQWRRLHAWRSAVNRDDLGFKSFMSDRFTRKGKRRTGFALQAAGQAKDSPPSGDFGPSSPSGRKERLAYIPNPSGPMVVGRPPRRRAYDIIRPLRSALSSSRPNRDQWPPWSRHSSFLEARTRRKRSPCTSLAGGSSPRPGDYDTSNLRRPVARMHRQAASWARCCRAGGDGHALALPNPHPVASALGASMSGERYRAHAGHIKRSASNDIYVHTPGELRDTRSRSPDYFLSAEMPNLRPVESHHQAPSARRESS